MNREPIIPEPNKFYWAWYDCRITIIQASADSYGFFVFGQDALWMWDNAQIICEAEPPLAVVLELLERRMHDE